MQRRVGTERHRSVTARPGKSGLRPPGPFAAGQGGSAAKPRGLIGPGDRSQSAGPRNMRGCRAGKRLPESPASLRERSAERPDLQLAGLGRPRQPRPALPAGVTRGTPGQRSRIGSKWFGNSDGSASGLSESGPRGVHPLLPDSGPQKTRPAAKPLPGGSGVRGATLERQSPRAVETAVPPHETSLPARKGVPSGKRASRRQGRAGS